MTEGAFWCSYDESVSLLKELGILIVDNRHQGMSYSPECKEYSRSNDYNEIYQKLIDHRDFDIQLFDDSFLQISFSNGESRYIFIQNPQEYLPFEKFLEMNGLDKLQNPIEELRGLFSEEYENSQAMMKINSGAVYMRYDMDQRGRMNNENIHAYSHLHIGLNNEIRIPVGVQITPLAFTMFVVRHVYYDIWVYAVRNSKVDMNHKLKCEELPSDLWTDAEKRMLFLV